VAVGAAEAVALFEAGEPGQAGPVHFEDRAFEVLVGGGEREAVFGLVVAGVPGVHA
jgi:hypothetical protein